MLLSILVACLTTAIVASSNETLRLWRDDQYVVVHCSSSIPQECCESLGSTFETFDCNLPKVHNLPNAVAWIPRSLAPTPTFGTAAEASSLLWNNQEHEWIEEEEEISSSTLSLHSTLSQSGGMHRDWTQRIVSSDGDSSYYYVLLYLPADVFINPEDEIPNIEFIDPPLIDQEEPAFASSSHAVLVKVSCSNTCEFTIPLHIRYPKPSSNDKRYRTLHIPSPRLFAATDGSVVVVRGSSSSSLSFQVATPPASDCNGVVIISVLAYLVGAIIMLRDMSKIAMWD